MNEERGEMRDEDEDEGRGERWGWSEDEGKLVALSSHVAVALDARQSVLKGLRCGSRNRIPSSMLGLPLHSHP